MRRRLALMVLLAGSLTAAVAEADVSVNVNLGPPPPPPIVLAAPPPLVVAHSATMSGCVALMRVWMPVTSARTRTTSAVGKVPSRYTTRPSTRVRATSRPLPW